MRMSLGTGQKKAALSAADINFQRALRREIAVYRQLRQPARRVDYGGWNRFRLRVDLESASEQL